MQCTKCGKTDHKENSSFCSGCGAPLSRPENKGSGVKVGNVGYLEGGIQDNSLRGAASVGNIHINLASEKMAPASPKAMQYEDCPVCGGLLEPKPGKAFRCRGCGKLCHEECRMQAPGRRLPYCADCGQEMAGELGPPDVGQAAPAVEQSSDGRYTKDSRGVITDNRTGLEWYVGPDEDTNWHDAQSWVEHLPVAGGGWRMPTRNELGGISQKGTRIGDPEYLPSIFKTSGWFVWSSERRDSSGVWGFDSHHGLDGWGTMGHADHRRAFAVRPRNK